MKIYQVPNKNYLWHPKQKKIENAEEILNASAEAERYSFVIFYTPAEKQVVLSELKSIGCVITGQSDDTSSAIALMTMEQLAAIKTLDCVERVEVYHPSETALSDEGVENISLNNSIENSIIMEDNNLVVQPTALLVENATVLTTNDMSTAIQLSLNSWESGEICCPGAEVWYKFTPSATAYYTIYTGGSLDTVGYLYDASCNQIDNDDDSGSGMNFRIVKQLTKGRTYYIKTKASGSNTGGFSIAVTNTVFVEWLTIDNETITLNKGSSATLSATILPSYATNCCNSWLNYRSYSG